MFDAARLSRLRPGSYLVNVARGALIDEAALLAGLDAGRPAGAALDVLTVEPAPADHPLVTHPRVLATPHIAGATVDMLRRSAELAVENIDRFLAGQEPS